MKINHITLLITDKKRAKNFYVEALGFKEKKVGKHLWIDIGGQYLHLTNNSGKPVKNTFYHFSLEVENLEKYIYKLQNMGIKVFDVAQNKMQCLFVIRMEI